MENVRHLDRPDHLVVDDPEQGGAFDRAQPHDLDAERAVLGGMLLNNTLIPDITELLAAPDYYRPAHTRLHQLILELHSRGEPADPITLTAELTKRGELAKAGGAGYVHGLLNAPAAGNAEYYAEIVHDHALRRAVIQLGQRIAASGYAVDDPDEILTTARIALTDITAGNQTSSDRFIDGASFILDLPDHVPAVWGEGDQILWAEGEALLIAGPAGVGKTTLAQQVILAAIGIRPHALGLAVRPVKKFLYLASDRPAQAGRSLARMVTENDRAVLAQQLVAWKGPPPTDFIKDPSILLRLCRQAGADAVCLDSLKDMAGELASEEGGQAINSAIQRCLAEGIEVIGLHHHRKQGGGKEGGKEPLRLDELYGSTWITAGAGSVISLWGSAGDPIVQMRHLKQPAAECGPYRLKHDHPVGHTEIWHEVDVLDVLLHARGPLTAQQLAAQIYAPEKGKPSPSETEKARRRLDQLVERGLARKIPGAGGRGAQAGYVAAFDESGEIR